MTVILRNPLIFGIILAISIALNLFLSSVIIGWSVRGDRHPPPPRDLLLESPPDILRVLPEARERVQPILRRNASFVHPKIQQLRRVKQELEQHITIEPLDTVALTKAFTQLRQAELETKTAVHQAVIEIMSVLSQDERQRLAHSKEANRRHRRSSSDEPPPYFRKTEELVKERDVNHDGKLSREEFLAQELPPAERRFRELDMNEDGFLTPSELETGSPPRHPKDFEDF